MKYVDMHCDTLYKMLQRKKQGENVSIAENAGHIDLDKLKRGNALLQNFAMFVEWKKCDNPKDEVLRMVDLFYAEMEKNRDCILPVRTYDEIMENERNGKMSALLTIEEGAACLGDLDNLELFYDLGVRMMTLTWNYPNEIGYPNLLKVSKETKQESAEGDKTGNPGMEKQVFDYKTPDTEHGLTPFGIQAVERMEELGMIVDVSHLSDAGFYDVLRATKKPFVASHSNARALCPWVRNLTDDMLRSLADRGGVAGLNFCADFLTEVELGTYNPGTMEAVIDHARHMINIGGRECLGIGSDFDGIDTNEGIPDYSYMPKLEEAFNRAGFRESECDKIFRDNVLRVYREIL
ncbi:MAG: dipeptidase [Lachnospiraceae bacterium]|nr:dipeptidase [Lachnospiraceae bacterium]